jgi:hypothetical protein
MPFATTTRKSSEQITGGFLIAASIASIAAFQRWQNHRG